MGANDIGAPPPPGALYRIVWRWHFYAGLICLPFLGLLATTGALYLFRDELSLLVERQRLVVVEHGPALPADALIARARLAAPGQAVRYTPPPAPERSAEVGVRTPDGEIVGVFLDPADGKVLDIVADDARPMKLISRIHSLAVAGEIPNLAIEIVAGWAILLVASGVFLWWPRGRKGGVVTLRGAPAQRIWWRDLHAVAGIFAAAMVLFLAVTGMPWSAFWGDHFRQIVNDAGLGKPAKAQATGLASDAALAAVAPGSWTMDATAPPTVTPSGPRPLPVAAVEAAAARLGMAPGYVIRLPASAGGVYTLQLYPKTATGQRVVHLDQYNGKVLADVGYRDYGAGSKVVEMGIAIHTGGQFGRANQLLMLAGCLAILGLAISSVAMWWKRRPRGRLAAPPSPSAKALSAFAVFALAIGALFPLLGLSVVAVLLIDRLVPAFLKHKYAL